jgi:hypothetical protein
MHTNQAGQMRMRLDTAWYYDFPGGIDYPTSLRGWMVNPNRHYPLALDADTPFANAVGRDYLATADQEIEHKSSSALLGNPHRTNQARRI